jgi:hypothetical protein
VADSTTPPPSPLAQLLEHRLSVERLKPYRRAVGGGLEPAIQLYEWNGAVSSAFFEVIGHFEVALRNAMHDQLTTWHAGRSRDGQWYDDPTGVLDSRRHDDIREARSRIRREGKTETPGKVVAELMFGFWRFLLDRHYQNTLWAQALRHAFPHLVPQRRVLVYHPVYDIARLRNRIAHHEPVHHLALSDRHDALLRVAGYIEPAVEAWLGGLSRVPGLLAARP